MTFQSMLVTQDDEAADVLTPVLAGFGLSVQRFGYAEALQQLRTQQYSAVFVDFDDPENALPVLQSSAGLVTSALLADNSKVRGVFGAGANFVIYKPVSASQAEATLRAAIALIKRERRRATRVPIQVPVWLRIQNLPESEGILLDLSEGGMEVLSSQPLCPLSSIGFRFGIPDGTAVEGRGEVAWAQPNGQSGVRFVDVPQHIIGSLREWVAVNARELPPDDQQPIARCKLTDLSLGACYLETESPFPERSTVALRLRADNMEVEACGTVLVMHPACGMGVEFAASTAEQQEQVRTFIEFLTTRPGVTPELLVSPASLPLDSPRAASNNAELDDPLLDLLRNHESLSRDQFLDELRQQRSAVVSVV